MKNFLTRFLIWLLFPGFAAPISAFTQKISGRVLNEGGKGAFHVTVQFSKANSVFTNLDGTFAITATRLPDTLFFFAPGFEPYKVIVTTETTTDPHFDIVLLNTRRKVKSSDVAGTIADEKKNNTGSADLNGKQPNGSNQGSSPGPNYISGKRLFMIDTVAIHGSVVYKSGLLTAGELNDFNKWRLWEDFSESDFKNYSEHWGLYPKQRYCVQLQNKDHAAIIGQPVFLIDTKTNDTVWSARTDNTGKAELWSDMDGSNIGGIYRIASNGADDDKSPALFPGGVNRMQSNAPCAVSGTVDIAVVVDATGSMSNEIDFLKIELEEVLRNTFAEYRDLDLHVGSVFYRDRGDEYITRYVNFQTDLLKVLNFIKLQRASGGGDVPEAVHLALLTALDSLHWSSTARSRILFLVTDAPPHDETRNKIFQLIQKAAAKGVRIVPVICRGADKSTEFIMRSMALATNGTYVFLTDDANAQFEHGNTAPNVVNVQFLNSLLERIIKQMVLANPCAGSSDVEVSKTIPGNIANISVTQDAAGQSITVESKDPLAEVFIADFTGKILKRLETAEKQNRWLVDVRSFPNGTFLVKYITGENRAGAEKFILSR